MKNLIRRLVWQSILNSGERDLFGLTDVENTVSIEVSRPKDPKFGDYATNAALVMAARARMKPLDLAAMLVEHMPKDPTVLKAAKVAGPGFINFFLADDVWREVLHRIHAERECYGTSPVQEAPRVLIEFVSANPTGPLHVGHGRGAAVGDTLARLLKSCGHNVSTEYYVNDAGNQMKILGRSVLLRFRELDGLSVEFPDNHYQGDYIRDLAKELMGTSLGEEVRKASEEEAVELASSFARERILDGIREDLGIFGVHYDNYFHETALHKAGALDAAVAELRDKGRVEEKEGALWFTMDEQEDEKDRVLVRATGEPTYFAADVAYHKDKLQRGFDMMVNIWGSDHHGYVPRVRAALEALGGTAESLKVLLVQFVTLVREGKKLSMSTRSGEFVTLREVLNEVGCDAARFFFLTKRSDSHLDFDLDLAKKQSKDNPVYYVQYAHARVASIFRIADERGIDTDMSDPDLSAVSLPEEERLIKHLAEFPDMLVEAADAFEPHRITFYLVELAELFHAYYHDNRVLLDDVRLKKARLYLVEAVRLVIAAGLKILAVNAPDRM